MSRFCVGLSLGFLLACASTAAAVSYDESISGDIGSFELPTMLSLDAGANIVSGAVGPIATDRNDGIVLAVPNGASLTQVYLDAYTNPGAAGDLTSSLFVITNTFVKGGPVYSVVLDSSDVGTDLLPALSAKIPQGEHIVQYTMDEQNSTAKYTLNFEVVENRRSPAFGCGTGVEWGALGSLSVLCFTKREFFPPRRRRA